jgi:hypothetical protein
MMAIPAGPRAASSGATAADITSSTNNVDATLGKR